MSFRTLARRLVPARFHPPLHRLRMLLQRLGPGRHCPLCGWRGRTFMPGGVVSRAEAQCPWCDSLERHRLLWLFLQEETDLLQDDSGDRPAGPRRLLHVAPPPMMERRLARSFPGLYVTLDLQAPKVKVRADVTALPFPTDSFDVVLCNHVLEHVPEDRVAMAEVRRILRPEGWALLQTPFEPDRPHTYEDPSFATEEERRKAFGQVDHVRIYGADFPRRLEEAGFRLTRCRFLDGRSLEERRRWGLPEEEEILLCRPDQGEEA